MKTKLKKIKKSKRFYYYIDNNNLNQGQYYYSCLALPHGGYLKIMNRKNSNRHGLFVSIYK